MELNLVSAALLISLIIKSLSKGLPLAWEIYLAVFVAEIMAIGGAVVKFCETVVKPSNTSCLANK